MPVYEHKCKCGEFVAEFRKLVDWDKKPLCPKCQTPMPQRHTNKAIRGNYKKPILLQSMGFLADVADVVEHRQRFPDIELSFQDGSAIPVVKSLGQKRSYLKAMGWIDKNSFT